MAGSVRGRKVTFFNKYIYQRDSLSETAGVTFSQHRDTVFRSSTEYKCEPGLIAIILQRASHPAIQEICQETSQSFSQPASHSFSQPSSNPASQPFIKPASQPVCQPVTRPARRPRCPLTRITRATAAGLIIWTPHLGNLAFGTRYLYVK